MHFCTAFVAIAGDDQQVVYRGPFNPISWPEIEVLRTVHGEMAVREVKPFVHVEQTVVDEQQRLLLIYGDVVTKEVFRGRRPNMELDAAEMDVLEPGTLWQNPITLAVETVPVLEEAAGEAEEQAPRDKLSRLAKARPRNAKGQLLPAAPDEPTPNL